MRIEADRGEHLKRVKNVGETLGEPPPPHSSSVPRRADPDRRDRLEFKPGV
jgi:hypothetical protein